MYVRYYIHVSLKNKFYFSERDFYVVLPTNKLETENIVCFSISKKAIYAKIWYSVSSTFETSCHVANANFLSKELLKRIVLELKMCQ